MKEKVGTCCWVWCRAGPDYAVVQAPALMHYGQLPVLASTTGRYAV